MYIQFIVYLFIGFLWADLKCSSLYFFCESERVYSIIKTEWIASLICVLFDVVFWPITSLNVLRKVI